MTGTDLSDFLVSPVQDPLSRVDGVGEVQVFGARYAMRIWIDRRGSPTTASPRPTCAGADGAEHPGVRRPARRRAGGALARASPPPSPRRAGCRPSPSSGHPAAQQPAGGEVRLKDVARVEIGAENYGTVARFNGQPAAGSASASPPAPTRSTPRPRCAPKLDEMSASSPSGVRYVVPYDTTPFVRRSPSNRW